MVKHYNTDELMAMLRERYPKPAWAFLEQVHERTGWACRSADAIAMSLWPSRGFDILGFEVKVSRSDWLRELKKPDKADVIAMLCNRWYIVAPRELIKNDELPSMWGLLCPEGEHLVCIKEAPFKNKYKDVSREFLAAILRRAQEQITDDAKVKTLCDQAVATAIEGVRKGDAHLAQIREMNYEQLKDKVQAFEKEAGVDITSWRRGDVGQAVKFLLAGGLEGQKNEIKKLTDELSKIIDKLCTLCSSSSSELPLINTSKCSTIEDRG
jgi:hypothetical protein